jgi:hypothetical protein
MYCRITVGEAKKLYAGKIRPEIIDAIFDHAEYGYPTGDFVEAVLDNDLKEAFGRADIGNRFMMFDIVELCYNYIPSGCWGSPDKVKAWRAKFETKPEPDTIAGLVDGSN